MGRTVTVATTQMTCSWDIEENLVRLRSQNTFGNGDRAARVLPWPPVVSFQMADQLTATSPDLALPGKGRTERACRRGCGREHYPPAGPAWTLFRNAVPDRVIRRPVPCNPLDAKPNSPATPQELFEAPYFCQEQLAKHYALANPVEGNPLIERFARLAKELGVVLPSESFRGGWDANVCGNGLRGLCTPTLAVMCSLSHTCPGMAQRRMWICAPSSVLQVLSPCARRRGCTPGFLARHWKWHTQARTHTGTTTACPAVSFFERAGNAYFNSLVVIDADGMTVGLYRKSHIPDGPGCGG